MKFYCVSRLSQIEICILFIFHFMLGVWFERKCLFLYSNLRSTTQLYKYMKDFLGGVRGGSYPPGTPLAPPLMFTPRSSFSSRASFSNSRPLPPQNLPPIIHLPPINTKKTPYPDKDSLLSNRYHTAYP